MDVTHQCRFNFKNSPGPEQIQVRKDQIKEYFLNSDSRMQTD